MTPEMFATFIESYKERYFPHFYSCDCLPGVYRDPEEAEKPTHVSTSLMKNMAPH